MRLLLLLLSFSILSSQWVIYRKNNPKRKIVCKPEMEWDNSTQETSQESGEEGHGEIRITRLKRDVEVDPERKEPIIFLGPKVNISSTFVDDGDFDIVSDYLSPEELTFVKEQIMSTCNYLDRQRTKTKDHKQGNHH